VAALSSGSKASRAAGYAVLILLVVAGASFLINTRVGGVQVYDVYPTPSMVPTLEVGDLVVVQSVSYSSLHVGDVIVFAEPTSSGTCLSTVIVHRIVEVTSQGLITQGDNRYTNPRPDEPDSWPPVPAACVRGEVMFSLPYLGEISQAFPPPLNYILVAIIIVIVFLIEFVTGGRSGEDEAPPLEATSKPPV
jgi:signal peptidase I